MGRASFRLLVCSTVLLSSAGHVSGLIVATSPRNVAALVNSSMSFSCKTDSKDPIRWQHVATHSDHLNLLFNGMQLGNKVSPGIDVVRSESKGDSALVIDGVQASDSGTYQCLEMYSSTQLKDFELTVIEATPVCRLTTSSSQIILRSLDYIEIRCTVRFIGNWIPAIRCYPETQPIESHTNVTDSSVAHYLKVSAASIATDRGGLANFTCIVSFESRSEALSPDPDAVAPSISFAWTSQEIRVIDKNDEGTQAEGQGGMPVPIMAVIFSVIGVLVICMLGMIVVMARFIASKNETHAAANAEDKGDSITQSQSSTRAETVADTDQPTETSVTEEPVYNDGGNVQYSEIDGHVDVDSNSPPYDGLVGYGPARPPIPSVYSQLAEAQQAEQATGAAAVAQHQPTEQPQQRA